MNSDLAKGCQRSHPHEEMDEVCQIKAELAQVRNENAHLRGRLKYWIRAKLKLDYAYRGFTQVEIAKLMDDPDFPEIQGMQERSSEPRSAKSLMEWSTAKPDKPGWYWMQRDSEFPECIEIYEHADDGLCVVSQATASHQIDDYCSLMAEEDCELRWSGPIPEPTEPQEAVR